MWCSAARARYELHQLPLGAGGSTSDSALAWVRAWRHERTVHTTHTMQGGAARRQPGATGRTAHGEPVRLKVHVTTSGPGRAITPCKWGNARHSTLLCALACSAQGNGPTRVRPPTVKNRLVDCCGEPVPADVRCGGGTWPTQQYMCGSVVCVSRVCCFSPASPFHPLKTRPPGAPGAENWLKAAAPTKAEIVFI